MTIAQFYNLETIKIKADGELVALFTNHGPTIGSFREARLRTYLKEHVARRYRIASGFVSDYDTNSVQISDRTSKQIDCLIYDSTDQVPLIESDAFVAVAPNEAAGFVEVKSDLKLYKEKASNKAPPSTTHPFNDNGIGYRWAGTLVEALSNIVESVRIMKAASISREQYFAGIISYNGDGLRQFKDALTSGELAQQLNISDLDYLPDCICVLNTGWWSFSAYPWFEGDEPTPEELQYDPTRSWMLSLTDTDTDLEGGPLQLFTAYLFHTCQVRINGKRNRVGGMRSSVGRNYRVTNTGLDLPCPGKDGVCP